MGCPLRLVVSPKTCGRNAVEFADRTKTFRTDLVYGDDRDFTETVKAVKAEIAKQLAALGC